MLQNRDYELTVVGMGMVDPACAEKIAALPEDTFSFGDTRALFRAIRAIVGDHGAPDLLTVQAELDKQKINLDGRLLIQTVKNAITTANYRQYETKLLELRKRRNLSKACSDLISRAANPGENVDAIVGDIMQAIRDNGNRSSAVTARDAMLNLINETEKKNDGVFSGISGLDRVTGGMKPGRLIILGARPGVGKTALALSMAANVAKRSGPVLIVSLEMDANEILTRIVADKANVNAEHIENHSLNADEWTAVCEASQSVADLPMRFSEDAVTPLQVRREAIAMQQDGGLKMIVIDYMQLMRADMPCKNRYEEISQISRELKLMAKELHVAVLALTQFNRSSEAGGSTRKPTMAEARDSGSIEQDANVFMTLYTPGEPKMGSDAYDFWTACRAAGTEFQILTVEKNRQGRTGEIPLEFDKPHMRFRTMMRETT